MIDSVLELPLQFTAIYECECGEQYDLQNCLVPRLMLPCEECGGQTMFHATYLIHDSWEWDIIDNDEEIAEGLDQDASQ